MTILILILVKENDKLSKKKGKKWVLYFFHTQHAWASWCGLSLPSSQLLWPLPFVYHKTIQLIYAPPSLLPYPLRQRPSACPLPPKPGGTVPFWLNPCLTQTPPPPHHRPHHASGGGVGGGDGRALLLFSPRSYLAASRFSGDLSDVDYNEVEDVVGCFPIGVYARGVH